MSHINFYLIDFFEFYFSHQAKIILVDLFFIFNLCQLNLTSQYDSIHSMTYFLN
jgi:hypothetical protein